MILVYIGHITNTMYYTTMQIIILANFQKEWFRSRQKIRLSESGEIYSLYSQAYGGKKVRTLNKSIKLLFLLPASAATIKVLQ